MSKRTMHEINAAKEELYKEIENLKIYNATTVAQLNELIERVKEIKELLVEQNGRLRETEINLESLRAKVKLIQWILPTVFAIITSIIYWIITHLK
mgnify:CR=1 FL=1